MPATKRKASAALAMFSVLYTAATFATVTFIGEGSIPGTARD